VVCDCIEKMNAKLREETGDSDARVAASYGVALNSVERFARIKTLHSDRPRNGTLSHVESRRHIVGRHCPFCGKELRYKRS
jgi:hypothetical protein